MSQSKQEKNESFTAFITRVRKQAKNCSYAPAALEEAIQGQLINGCNSAEIRTELMKQTEEAMLADFEKVARTIETITLQSSAMASSDFTTTASTPSSSAISNVCRVPEKGKRNTYAQKGKKFQKDSSKCPSSDRESEEYCFRCGHQDYRAKDPNCPAIKAVCSKCKKVGHYSKVCRSSTSKSEQAKDKVKRIVNDDEKVFCVRADKSTDKKSEEWVPCTVGNVPCEMFIDSGAMYSMMSRKTWPQLQRKNVKFHDYVPKPSVNFYDAAGDKQCVTTSVLR